MVAYTPEICRGMSSSSIWKFITMHSNYYQDILFIIKEDLKRLKSYLTLSVGEGFLLTITSTGEKRNRHKHTLCLAETKDRPYRPSY